jgi:hypothetical protein
MYGRKYGVISQNGVFWFFERKSAMRMQRRYRTTLSDNAILLRLKQFQETDSDLHRKGVGRSSTLQEVADRIQAAFSQNPQKSGRRSSMQLGMPQTTLEDCL